MATSALIPVSEYLATSYRPDRDYIEGELQERNLGEQDHSDLQTQLILLLGTQTNKTHIRVNPEIRVQVGRDRFRVPDVCVRKADAPSEQIVHHPPLLCIEILSPRDTVSGMRERIRDFLVMGVEQVWLLDPHTRTAIVCAGSTMVEQTSGDLNVPGTPIVLSLADIFRVLDEY